MHNPFLHNVWLIARREYLERVRTKGFMFATVLIPTLMGTLVFGSLLLMTTSKTQSHIAVVTSDQNFGTDLRHQLEAGRDADMKVDVYAPSDAIRDQLVREIHNRNSTLAGYLWVTPATSPGKNPDLAFTARSVGDIATKTTLEVAINSVLMRERLAANHVPAADIDTLMEPVKLDTSATGDTTTAFNAAYMLFFLMYMVIMLYGMNTARSIIDEKTSRIFEVLLATIKPDELLAGKILGVGAVGLTQIGVWMVGAFAILNSGLSHNLSPKGHPIISSAQIGFFVLYFMFGFLIYSSVAAALGAMTNSEQELQQLNMFLVIPLAFCMVMIFAIIRAPDSGLATVVSLIPFCSPLLMNFRISLTHVPAWQINLSVMLMSFTVAIILWFASRIYRVGILMYGKKPSLVEMLRWMKYS
ncbi:MAG: ABC transporter permease [Acidobacteriota bacterium]